VFTEIPVPFRIMPSPPGDLRANEETGMENERVVVVTGASSGLGHAVARRLAEDGVSLVLASRRASLIDDLATECRRMGVRALSVRADVGMEDDVRHVASRAVDAFGRVDAWINGAGASGTDAIRAGVGLTDEERVVRTNLLGTMYGSQQAMTIFRRQRSGVLINIASSPARIPAPYFAACSAARFGIVGLGAALREEIRDTGLWDVHVCTVIPVPSPALEASRARSDGRAGEQAVDHRPTVEAIVGLIDHPRHEVMAGRQAAYPPATGSDALRVDLHGCPGRTAHADDAETTTTLEDLLPVPARSVGAM
jgi:short-subunit dehydrogenase